MYRLVTLLVPNMSYNLKSLSLATASSQCAYILDAAQTGLDLATTFTIEFWLKFTTAANFPALVSKDDDTQAATRSYIILLYNDAKMNVLIGNGAGQYDQYAYNTALATNEWHHWAVTCNTGNASATTFEFFKDGQSVGNGVGVSTGNIATITNSTTAFVIGGRQDKGTISDNFLNGLMDDVRVWNIVRTPAQISSNYQSEFNSSQPGLVSYWKFNGNYNDFNNVNNLTAMNTPSFSDDVPFVGTPTMREYVTSRGYISDRGSI
jgi:hypothetical protein